MKVPDICKDRHSKFMRSTPTLSGTLRPHISRTLVRLSSAMELREETETKQIQKPALASRLHGKERQMSLVLFPGVQSISSRCGKELRRMLYEPFIVTEVFVIPMLECPGTIYHANLATIVLHHRT